MTDNGQVATEGVNQQDRPAATDQEMSDFQRDAEARRQAMRERSAAFRLADDVSWTALISAGLAVVAVMLLGTPALAVGCGVGAIALGRRATRTQAGSPQASTGRTVNRWIARVGQILAVAAVGLGALTVVLDLL